MSRSTDDEPTDVEREILHELQLTIEEIYRGYGALLEYHHQIGCRMDKLNSAKLEKSGNFINGTQLR